VLDILVDMTIDTAFDSIIDAIKDILYDTDALDADSIREQYDNVLAELTANNDNEEQAI